MLVTGGSRGIGLMMARGFVEEGARVFVSSRDAAACAAAAAELSAIGTCVALPADVGTEDGQAALVAALAEHTAELDVLVNNAGTAWGAPIEDYPMAAFDKLWAVNAKPVFGLTQRLLGPLRRAAEVRPPARVINIGSVDALRVPAFDNFAYSATKAAAHMLTRHMAHRLAPAITVNAIAPGPFLSRMTKGVWGTEEGHADIVSRVPMARLGAPEDAAGAAIFLAGPAAAWITGTVMVLDGGTTLGGPPAAPAV